MRIIWIVLTGFLSGTPGLFSQQNPSPPSEASPAEWVVPKKVESPLYTATSGNQSLIWSIYLFLFMVLVMGGLFFYQRKGKFSIKGFANSGKLKIQETRYLGNKQFLMVVEYEKQKILLGVSPGVIQHLCYLDSEAVHAGDEEVQDARG
jgi:flagellar biogenesis protein FliO